MKHRGMTILANNVHVGRIARPNEHGQLGVNISAAARQGVTDAVRAALERSDRKRI